METTRKTTILKTALAAVAIAAAIRMRWDDKARTLTLADQEGTFRYSRTFRVRIATENGDAKSVEYNGKVSTVNF